MVEQSKGARYHEDQKGDDTTILVKQRLTTDNSYHLEMNDVRDDKDDFLFNMIDGGSGSFGIIII
jgi:hypothetical protein